MSANVGFPAAVRRAIFMSAAAILGLAAILEATPSRGEVPAGGPDAQTGGVFSQPFTWPIIAIHAVLLPDGRVLNYGTDELGRQGARLVYDIWSPAEGTDLSAHLVLPNTTATDVFCSGQSVLPGSGEVVITGGDQTIDGKRNYSIPDTTVFSPQTDTIRPNGAMAFARWYPSVVAMPDGDMVILGGREDKSKTCNGEGLNCIAKSILTPEIYNESSGWRLLSGATSEAYFLKNWFYPRSSLTPNGQILLLDNYGKSYLLDSSGEGSIAEQAMRLPGASSTMPSAVYSPGKLLAVRWGGRVFSIDTNAVAPKAKRVADLPGNRLWSNMVVLANGTVAVNGGGTTPNKLDSAVYQVDLWDPATGQWTVGAAAQKPRLYHSTALLLPDASVLTAGGGAPGPAKNLNAEIYYPPYLYAADGSGQPAVRPELADAPSAVGVGQAFTAAVVGGVPISRVTMVRTGSVTHSYNSDQRFLEPSFTQSGDSLSITMPENENVALPGYYMLFALDQAGVPSVARMVRVTR